MATILNSAILNLAILDSAILVFPFKLTHTCQDWFPPFAQKKLHWHFPAYHLHKKLHSFILTQFHDGGHLEFCHLEFHHLRFSHLSFTSQTHSYLPRLVPTICTKKNFTHSFWLNFMMVDILNSAILNSTILDSAILVFLSNSLILAKIGSHHLHKKKVHSHFPPHHLHKKTSLIHSDSTWWWWPSWILPSWILPTWIQLLYCGIQTPCFLLSDSLKNTLLPLWVWLKLIQSDSNSFILTQLDDGSHLEFSQLGFSHFAQKTSLIHSDLTWWWQPSWIWPSWIQES